MIISYIAMCLYTHGRTCRYSYVQSLYVTETYSTVATCPQNLMTREFINNFDCGKNYSLKATSMMGMTLAFHKNTKLSIIIDKTFNMSCKISLSL